MQIFELGASWPRHRFVWNDLNEFESKPTQQTKANQKKTKQKKSKPNTKQKKGRETKLFSDLHLWICSFPKFGQTRFYHPPPRRMPYPPWSEQTLPEPGEEFTLRSTGPHRDSPVVFFGGQFAWPGQWKKELWPWGLRVFWGGMKSYPELCGGL